MDYNILIGGAAGQGIDTVAQVLNKVLQKNGLHVYTTADYLSRVRGGHNFFQVRVADHPITSHRRELDLVFALNEETLETHLPRLKEGGISFSDDAVQGYPDTKKFDLTKKAESIGNEKVVTSIGLAVILRHLGLQLDSAEEVLTETLKEGLVDMNIEALRYGYELLDADQSYDAVESERILIDGNAAIGFGAVAAGCRFYCGYPMTPSSGILGFMDAVSEELGVVVDQVEDEVAALNMAIGASHAGVRAMTATSGGGFALMQEAMSLAGQSETPVVVVNAQRPGPATGLPTYTEQADLRFVIHAGHGEFPRKVIALRTADDAFHQTARAFDQAEKYQIPVVLMTDQYLADANVTTDPFDLEAVSIRRHLADPSAYEPGSYRRYAFTEDGVSPRLVPGRAKDQLVIAGSDEHDEQGRIDESADNRRKMVEKRHKKREGITRDLEEPWEFGTDDFDTLVVCWGSTYGIVREAVERMNEEGYRIRGLAFGDVYPVPLEKFTRYQKQAKHYIAVEQNHDAQFEALLRQEALVRADHTITKYDGRAFYPEEIMEQLKEVL